MSEDDRAAKAARAKAMLKKRQQKKAADSGVAPSSSGAASPARTFSPAPAELSPSEPAGEQVRDLGDVFANSKDASDTSWLNTLPRVASPPPSVPPRATPPIHSNGSAKSPPPVVASPPAQHITAPPPSKVSGLEKRVEALLKENEGFALEISRLKAFESAAQQAEASLETERRNVEELKGSYEKLQKDSEIALENEHRTVSLLVTEKAHLTSELQKLDDFEARAQTLGEQLEAERVKSDGLDEQVTRLQIEFEELSRRAEQSKDREKELVEHNKEQERELQILSATAADSRKEADDFKRRLRELEEQIQSDDRVERLESSLKHTQDRADELEFQLTKVKQAQTSLKAERDALDSRLQESSSRESDWTEKMTALDTEIAALREQLTTMGEQRDRLLEDKTGLLAASEARDNTVKDLQNKLAQAAAAMATTTRQMQTTQNELKNAIRRAEDAEKTQKSLQAEGTNLMRSLDEMRPKIVELTAVKLDLGERVESLEHSVRTRDATIAQLENDVGEARDNIEQSERVWKDKLAQQEKRHADAQNGTLDIQKAYSDLQEELDTALASLRNLESQRANHHQEAARRLEEIEKLSNVTQSQSDELESVRRELEARRGSQDEEQGFLERAQNEIEYLRAELNTRDEEIEQLREVVNSPQSEAPRSLDDEMLGSIRQQHALELSAATSQIRSLENTIFDKDTAIHALQKRLNTVEEQLRPLSRLAQRPSPGPSRPASRAHDNELRRSSFGSHRPGHLPTPLSRTVFDQAMTPETLHKRKVSLSMLKARIESETKALTHAPSLSPVQDTENPRTRPTSTVADHHQQHHIHRPQFLDESHVFWCHSCTGDLVIL